VSESLAFSAILSKRQVKNRDVEIFGTANQGNISKLCDLDLIGSHSLPDPCACLEQTWPAAAGAILSQRHPKPGNCPWLPCWCVMITAILYRRDFDIRPNAICVNQRCFEITKTAKRQHSKRQ
jgi:hypothetical protein